MEKTGKTLLTIDLGTSSVKAALFGENLELFAVSSREYPIIAVRPGYAEQNPEVWWRAAAEAVREALAEAGKHTDAEIRKTVSAVGVTGQMHGCVLLDGRGGVLGNAVIWPDRRSAEETEEFSSLVGEKHLAQEAGTAPAPGFMGTTLLWIQKNDPRRLKEARTCLFPKDYIRFRLTGDIGTDPTDGSGSALFDVNERTWSSNIIGKLGFPATIFPQVREPDVIAGSLTDSVSRELSLPKGIPVVTGCADQAALAVGNGMIGSGLGSITIGSGGQIVVPVESPRVLERLNLHLFCHAPAARWYVLGAMLSAGLSFRWLRDVMSEGTLPGTYERLSGMAGRIEPGSEGLVFLPYLSGERSPHMDPDVRGGFFGLTLSHGKGHMARAVMEGVAFALKQILETMVGMEIQPGRLLASGNGFQSGVWLKIVSDVLGMSLYRTAGREQTCLGAAVIAGIGSGLFQSYEDAIGFVPPPAPAAKPDLGTADIYREHYQRFKQLYPELKNVFP